MADVSTRRAYPTDLSDEQWAAEAVGLSFHGLDFVVGSFQRTGGDRGVVPGQEWVASVLANCFNRRTPEYSASRIQQSRRAAAQALSG